MAQPLQRRRHQEPAQLSRLATRPRSLGRPTRPRSLDQRRHRQRTIPTANAIRARLSYEPVPFERSRADSRSRRASRRRRCRMEGLTVDELQQQATDFFGLFLLDPMSGVIDKMRASPLTTSRRLHALKRARKLIDAPIALARDETGRHIDGAARKRFKLADVFAG